MPAVSMRLRSCPPFPLCEPRASCALGRDRGLFNEVHQNANNLSIFGSKFGCLACVRAAHQESVLVLGVTNVATQEVT